MTITLKPELEAMIREDVARGVHDSVEHFVEAAVLSFHQQEIWDSRSSAEITAFIDEGWEQAKRGELYTEAEVRVRMEAMKTEWRAQQTR